MANLPTVISFAAPSGTGKTTLICALVEELTQRGFRVGSVKSDAHRVQLDTPGKDTHRMRESGSQTTALVSKDQIAVFRDAPGKEIALSDVISLFFSEMNVVLAEGFREHGFPAVLVQRKAVSDAGWRRPGNVVAIVSDRDGPDAPCDDDDVPSFSLDDVAGIADFLCERVLGESGESD